MRGIVEEAKNGTTEKCSAIPNTFTESIASRYAKNGKRTTGGIRE